MGRTANPDIYFLVRSLQEAELKFFRQFLNERGGLKPSNSEILLEALLSLPTFDQGQLELALPTRIVGNLSFEKNQLMKLVLKTLRQYHADQRIDLKVQNLITDARFLQERGLYARSQQQLAHARQLAQRHQMTLVLMEINTLERFAEKRLFEKHIESQLEAQIESGNAETKRWEQQNAYRNLYDRIFVSLRENYKLRTEAAEAQLEQYRQDELMQSFPSDGTFESQKLYYLIQGQLAQMERNQEGFHLAYRQAVALWDKFPHLKQLRRIDYKATLANYLQTCHEVKNYAAFEPILTELKSLPPQSEEEAIEDFQNILFLELLGAMNTSNWVLANSLLVPIEIGIGKYGTQINQSRFLVYHHNVAILLFVQERYKESSRWLQRILDIKRSKHRRDIRNFSKVFNIILHYELGRIELLEHFFRSVYRKLKRNRDLYEFEKLVLNGIKKLQDAIPGQPQAVFAEIHSALNTLGQNPKERRVTGFAEVALYVRSKVEGKAMMDLIPN